MKKLLLLIMLASVAFAQTNLEDFRCENITGQYYCPDVTYNENVPIKMIEDIYCVSSDNVTCSGQQCADIVDVGCMGSAEIRTDITINTCQIPINNSFAPMCSYTALPSGSAILLLFDPKTIDYSQCTQPIIDGFYTIQCPYAGKEFTATLGFFNESDIAFVVEQNTSASVSSDLFIYGGFVLVIIILAYYIVIKPAPRKIK